MSWKIFAHGDSDGICSGAILKKALGGKVWFTNPVGLLGDLGDVRNQNVAITDIAITNAHKDKIVEEMKRISKNNKLIYVDHHPYPGDLDIPGEVHHETDKSSSEIAYFSMKDELPREFVKVTLYGAIGDYADNTEWALNEMERWDKRVIYFQSGMLSEALGEARGKYDLKRIWVNKFCNGKEPSEIDKLVELALREAKYDKELYYDIEEGVEEIGDVSYAVIDIGSLSKGAHFAMGITDNKVGVCGIEDKEDVDMSIRTRRETDINLNDAVSKAAENVGGVGGGHESAAGASVPKNKFENFVENLDKLIS
ncbi:MAG: DHHA1 domain-containing protein [Candidatus Aenigmatarchaeota archaeon]